MAITHEAYLFQESTFVSRVSPFLDACENEETYQRLRHEVIHILETNIHVQELANIYGAWDVKGIIDLDPGGPPYTEVDVGFYFTFMLYSSLDDLGSTRIGLGKHENVRLVEQTLASLGWEEADIDLIRKGKSFQHFPRKWLADTVEAKGHGKYWEHINPQSTSGSIGWLGLSDLTTLLVKLRRDETRLAEKELSARELRPVEAVYKLAKTMVEHAVEQDKALCIILSG